MRFTKDLVQKRGGARYIIRPEFILNFIALSPTTEEVRNSYNAIFPTLLSVQLSNRMREEIFHDVMRKFKEINVVDEARAKVIMSELSNRLMGDNHRKYDVDLTSWSLEAR